MIEASCHCGNVSLTIKDKPKALISCNCSICQRLGALWGYFPPEEITVTIKDSPTRTYQWGDKNINFQHCPNCGSTTHYIPTKESGREKMAVNFRMVDKAVSDDIHVKYFDGAITWKFVDAL